MYLFHGNELDVRSNKATGIKMSGSFKNALACRYMTIVVSSVW